MRFFIYLESTFINGVWEEPKFIQWARLFNIIKESLVLSIDLWCCLYYKPCSPVHGLVSEFLILLWALRTLPFKHGSRMRFCFGEFAWYVLSREALTISCNAKWWWGILKPTEETLGSDEPALSPGSTISQPCDLEQLLQPFWASAPSSVKWGWKYTPPRIVVRITCCRLCKCKALNKYCLPLDHRHQTDDFSDALSHFPSPHQDVALNGAEIFLIPQMPLLVPAR